MAKKPYYTPLKTSENQRFSDVLRGYRNGFLTFSWGIEMEHWAKID